MSLPDIRAVVPALLLGTGEAQQAEDQNSEQTMEVDGAAETSAAESRSETAREPASGRPRSLPAIFMPPLLEMLPRAAKCHQLHLNTYFVPYKYLVIKVCWRCGTLGLLAGFRQCALNSAWHRFIRKNALSG